jgi:hypothetical protein
MHDSSMDLGARLRAGLMGTLFTTAKDLRHRAEAFGLLFVPTREIRTTSRSGHFVLDAGPVGEVHVHAKREQPWHPFLITEVHIARREGADVH